MHFVFGHVSLDRLIVVDRVPRLNEDILVEDFHENQGGAAANVAATLSLLGHQTEIVSQVGMDSFGDELRKDLENYGVSTEYLFVEPSHPTSRFTCVMGLNGARSFYLHTGASFFLEDKLEAVKYDSAQSLIFNGIGMTTMRKVLSQQEAKNLPVFVNLGTLISGRELDYDLDLFSRIDTAFVNHEELREYLNQMKISEDFFARVCKETEMNLVITEGRNGSRTWSNGNQMTVSAYEVKTIANTLGCGDAFIAGWLAKFFEGDTLSECARNGHFCASIIAAIPEERTLDLKKYE